MPHLASHIIASISTSTANIARHLFGMRLIDKHRTKLSRVNLPPPNQRFNFVNDTDSYIVNLKSTKTLVPSSAQQNCLSPKITLPELKRMSSLNDILWLEDEDSLEEFDEFEDQEPDAKSDESEQNSLDIQEQRSKGLYRFNHGRWREHPIDKNSPMKANPFVIATWNVDFSRSFPISRLITSLNHLQSLLEPLLAEEPPIPAIILIQELDASCFNTLLQHTFVQEHYDLTDITPKSWRAHYGVVTLIPRSLKVIKTFRTKFEGSCMGRDALFVDISFQMDNIHDNPSVIRVANVHLESLRDGDEERPRQLTVVSSSLSEPGIHGGIVGGDMNPIGPRDNVVPGELGFADAWMLCHDTNTATSPEEVERSNAESHTWGYQPPSRYRPCRMDKVLYKGSVTVREIERVGVGLAVDPAKVQGRRNVWASDHYGLLAKVEII